MQGVFPPINLLSLVLGLVFAFTPVEMRPLAPPKRQD